MDKNPTSNIQVFEEKKQHYRQNFNCICQHKYKKTMMVARQTILRLIKTYNLETENVDLVIKDGN